MSLANFVFLSFFGLTTLKIVVSIYMSICDTKVLAFLQSTLLLYTFTTKTKLMNAKTIWRVFSFCLQMWKIDVILMSASKPSRVIRGLCHEPKLEK